MRSGHAGLVAKTWNRARRLSTRMRERVRSWPVRARHRRAGLPIPPGRLIYLVCNTEDAAWFLASGRLAAHCLREILSANGIGLARSGAVLDFGCGAGRVIRHLADLDGPSLHGTDYNPALVNWCRRTLPFAQFHLNSLGGGTPFDPSSFNLIYAFSVFTHLSEPLQGFWMRALGRILRPGGHLLLSVHGESYLPALTDSERADFERGRLVIRAAERDGRNDCAVFHPELYVRQTLARGLTIIDHRPQGALGNPHQDLYLLRKPGPAESH
jgi:SAM-dependent methyltransferase